MLEISQALLLFTFSTSITPGPNNVMMLASGLNYGIKRSLLHLVGIAVGFTFMVLVVGAGFGLLFTRYPHIHEVIKIAGLIYLLILAWRIATTVPKGLDGSNRLPINFVQAALFQWLNPKAWMMATSGVATFLNAGEGQTFQLLQIAGTFMLASFTCTGSWLVFGAALKHVLNKPQYMQIFNLVMAGLLLLSIMPTLRQLINTYFITT